MAEAVFRKLADDRGIGDRFNVSSSGVSSEESGNDIYPPAKAELRRRGIPFSRRSLRRRFGDSPKIRMLLDRDVDDPWYTDDFATAYDDILKGCERLLDSLA